MPVEGFEDDGWARRYAAHADSSPYNAGYERPAMQQWLATLPRGARVLDAACAAGAQTAWLHDRGCRAVGLDLSAPLLSLARARVPGAGFVRASLLAPLPFASDCFDAVVSSLTLHYLEHWAAALREVARVLRPGGRLLLSTHHPFWDWPLRNPADYFDRGPVSKPWELSDGGSMPAHYYRRTLADVLNEVAAVFVVDEVREPQPAAWVAEAHPDVFALLSTEPAFLCIAARPR